MLTKKTMKLLVLALSFLVFTACDDNDSDTTTGDVPVNAAPIADGAGNLLPIAKAGSPETTVEIGETVKFVSRLSTDPDGEIVKYQWLENGVTIARVPFMWKVYNVPGTYNIKLVVTDNDGATASDEYIVTVTAAAGAAATVYDTDFEKVKTKTLPVATETKIKIDAIDAVPSITKVTVTINLVHPKDRKLIIRVKSPAGTHVVLSNLNGGNGDNFTDTTFDDNAATPIAAGTAPFTGTFIPDEPLANLVGEDPNGIWKLKIDNTATNARNEGTIYSWSITVQ